MLPRFDSRGGLLIMGFLRFVPSKFQIEVATPVPKGLPEWGVKRGWAIAWTAQTTLPFRWLLALVSRA